MPGEPAVALSCARLNGLVKGERDETAGKGKSGDEQARAGPSGATSPRMGTESSQLVVEPSWKRPVRVGCGLNNLVNTCYLNSVLQVLTYTPSLVNFVQSHHGAAACRAPPSRVCMLCVLRQHVSTVHNGAARGSISPTQFIVNLKGKSLCVFYHFPLLFNLLTCRSVSTKFPATLPQVFQCLLSPSLSCFLEFARGLEAVSANKQ